MSGGEPVDVFQLAGTTLEGRFVVERVVAEGGFGVVYRGLQVALERPIALKVLKTPVRFDEAAKQQFLSSFASEAKTIARIAHPNIVSVFDFGVSTMPSGVRAAWMALEWLTGITLEEELLRRHGRGGRSPAECLALLKPVLSALAIVHAEGVAHRDLKPANIMLVPTPAGTVLKLLDFGIAKIMDADEAPGTGQTRTRSSQVAYSPAYASPEQISNGRTGPWTDVHAMGLILSEVLTDRPPFDAEEMGVLYQQIVDRSRPTPARRGVDVGAWEAVIARSLAVPSAERYRDAGELLRALEAAVPAASATQVSIPEPAGGAVGAPQVGRPTSTLEAMSTQMARPADAVPPIRSNVTTGTPIAGDTSSLPGVRRSRGSLYLAGGAISCPPRRGDRLSRHRTAAGGAPVERSCSDRNYHSSGAKRLGVRARPLFGRCEPLNISAERIERFGSRGAVQSACDYCNEGYVHHTDRVRRSPSGAEQAGDEAGVSRNFLGDAHTAVDAPYAGHAAIEAPYGHSVLTCGRAVPRGDDRRRRLLLRGAAPAGQVVGLPLHAHYHPPRHRSDGSGRNRAPLARQDVLGDATCRR